MAHPVTSGTNPPYTPIRSAFTVIEKPLRFFYDRYNNHHYSHFKNGLGGMAVYPIVVGAAPLTMVADMIIGIAECIFCTIVRGDSLRDVAEVLRKKIVISPLHHLTFIIISLTPSTYFFGDILQLLATFAPGRSDTDLYWGSVKSSLILATGIAAFWISSPLLPEGQYDKKVFLKIPAPLQPFIQNRLLYMAVQFFFVALALGNFVFLEFHKAPKSSLLITTGIPLAINSLLWTFSYTLSQRMIGSFSPSWNHHTFSIFIGHGAEIKLVGTGFHFDGLELKPGMTFQDAGFTDHDLSYWKARYIRRFYTQPCQRPIPN